ncbi:RB1-inducible coiled-coil protein 1-like isoform X2 [Cydia pomonella]|uniref:RB1-inducible coiled-coil protein 1-like isoform X2 n=1 Tax=Cydia pomonella TaxID=82600 RepID=UPI002ADD8EB4|nr:RB1-inducible coiled-coil protein 1-like isoform X2 [Cydia pomonella]
MKKITGSNTFYNEVILHHQHGTFTRLMPASFEYTPGPKLVPRPTAASIARAALNATNRMPPQPQRPASIKTPSSPNSKRKTNIQRNIHEIYTKADNQVDTKIHDLEPIVDTKTDVNNFEESIEETLYRKEPLVISENLQEEPHLDIVLPSDCGESLVDSIDTASTLSISQPRTPIASRPQTPKSPGMTQAGGTRPNTPHSVQDSIQSTTPASRPTTPRKAQPMSQSIPLPNVSLTSSYLRNDTSEVDDHDLMSAYSAKQKQFQQMKKELDVKQQAVLEAFDSLRNLRERLPRESGMGSGEGAVQELLVFNVADWPAEELEQLYRGAAAADTDGAMQLIESVPIDESNFNEVEAKVMKMPEQFAELCLQAFAARQELIDWVKDLLLHSDNPQDCGEGETMQRIAHYNSQGLQLCDALRQLKEQADCAVDTVAYFSKRMWRDQNALISVGKVLVRDVACLKQNLETQANVVDQMQSQLHSLQNGTSNVQEIRQELEEERAAKNSLKEKLATSENQHRQSRNRITKMDRQLREAEASISTLTGTVKVLEDQSRQREIQLEARARKMRESLKTGEVASGHLAQKRDALQAEVTELRDQIEKVSAKYDSTIKDLENQLKETKSALEEQTLLNHNKDLEIATARNAALAESKATVEQLLTKIRELENKIAHNVEQKQPSSREMELVAELQATKETLRVVEEEVIVFKQEKVRFLETLAKIAETDDKVGMQQKLAAELLSKEEIIGKLQVQMRELTKNDKLLTQKVVQYEQYVKVLQAHRTGVTNLEESNEDFQKEILDLRMKLLEEIHRNEELKEALAKKDHQLEQQDKTSRAQARVIKVREELINLLKNKETEQTRELLALQQDLENRMKIVDEVNKQISAKAVEIQELFATLESKQQQIHRLEKIVLMLEEQQRRSQAQRTRHEEKIAALEHELAEGCRRERYAFPR